MPSSYFRPLELSSFVSGDFLFFIILRATLNYTKVGASPRFINVYICERSAKALMEMELLLNTCLE